MAEAKLRPRRRRRAGSAMAAAAAQYTALGWPVCPGARPIGRQHRGGRHRPHGPGRACSCDRIGCPAPGAHPISPAWQLEATADPAAVRAWWSLRPQANIVLATGRAFDVLDVPARAGQSALAGLGQAGIPPGPVAIGPGSRTLFFVTTRYSVADEDEWWSCHLDNEPESLPAVSGLRWHCRDSYVLAPPSRLSDGTAARWLVRPETAPLPDSLRLLEFLADACEEIDQ
jgi:hypothetical protein